MTVGKFYTITNTHVIHEENAAPTDATRFSRVRGGEIVI